MDHRTLARITTAATRTPRFLLRTFHSTSGGHVNLNTLSSITPLAFASYHPSDRIVDHTVASLQANVRAHIGFREDSGPTLFSSWSQDLAFIQQFIDYDNPTAHLAIIDTKAIGNIVVHAMELSEILGHDSHSTAEFLAFGPISGPGYKAVPIRSLLSLGFSSFFQGGDWQSKLDTAITIGVSFGPNFETPVAAYLLGQVCSVLTDEPEEAARAMEKVDIPKDWKRDGTLTGKGMAAFMVMSCLSAYKILECLIEGDLREGEGESEDEDAEFEIEED